MDSDHYMGEKCLVPKAHSDNIRAAADMLHSEQVRLWNRYDIELQKATHSYRDKIHFLGQELLRHRLHCKFCNLEESKEDLK